MNKPLSVSALNTQIKSLLESTFLQVYVEGEISNLTIHKSGHVYFSLKDTESTISAVLFKGNASYLKFRLEEGLKVIVYGSITVYTPRGNYQLLCQKIEPSGIGSLALAYEQLKTKLQNEGLFKAELKKPIPKFVKTIAVVTSPTGAAIEDMKKILEKRWPIAKMILVPSLVQGESAKDEIVKAIQIADTLGADVMIVGRGGGSIEDLWAFNEEIVARAIFVANTPIISAVGHESDTLISDFVADVRASTPSNAIEIATPDKFELIMGLDLMVEHYQRAMNIILSKKSQEIQSLQKMFVQNSMGAKIDLQLQGIEVIKNHFKSIMQSKLTLKSNEITFLKQNLIYLEPTSKIKNGYAQILHNGKIADVEKLQKDECIELVFSHKIFTAKILSSDFLSN